MVKGIMMRYLFTGQLFLAGCAVRREESFCLIFLPKRSGSTPAEPVPRRPSATKLILLVRLTRIWTNWAGIKTIHSTKELAEKLVIR